MLMISVGLTLIHDKRVLPEMTRPPKNAGAPALPDVAPDRAPDIAPDIAPDVALDDLPGHNIRRLHQIAVAIFLQETEGSGLTPVQYAALQAVTQRPGIDQRTLARAIGLDTSTTAGVLERLEARGLIARTTSREDRRARVLAPTDDGRRALAAVLPAMLRAQAQILAPLSADDQQVFLRLLQQLVSANNGLSRAPSGAPDTPPAG
jgi:DNA-binding MarR family transcriptional regulator